MRSIQSFLIVVLVLTGLACAADFVIIVNPANSASSVSKAELKRIYTGKMQQFSGQKVVPINLADADPLFAGFVDGVVGKSPSEYKQFWVEAQIKGQGSAPMVQRNSASAKLIVATVPGAIAYVEASAVDATVKKIDIK